MFYYHLFAKNNYYSKYQLYQAKPIVMKNKIVRKLSNKSFCLYFFSFFPLLIFNINENNYMM